MTTINPVHFTPENLERLAKEFRAGKPYPHICIDNFLQEEVANALFDNFPKMTDLRKHYNGLNENKSEGSSFDSYHDAFGKVQHEIMTPEFLKLIEKLTGIKGLSIPNDFRGAGVHQGKNGSFLDVHVDFSIHPTLKLHRRLNLLIYLNKNWKPEYGGAIELWNHDVTVLEKSLLPLFNRCVIFECNEISYHGYDVIHIPENESRKSIYAYYYTEPAPGVKYHDTIFKARPTEGSTKKLKTDIKEGLKNTVKSIFYKLGLKGLFEKIE